MRHAPLSALLRPHRERCVLGTARTSGSRGGHEDAAGAAAARPRGKARRAGAVQPGGARGGLAAAFQHLKGARERGAGC